MTSEAETTTLDPDAATAAAASRMQIFRHADGKPLMEAGAMRVSPSPAEVRPSIDKALQSGYVAGEQVRVVFSAGGLSLTHVWFKRNYPLPLHTHDADCLYYIIAGSLKLGTETLGARDGFFLPAGVPYTYKPGEQGVELLEFRTSETFDFKSLMNTVKFWEKAAEISVDNREAWTAAVPPEPELLPR